jgi:hypothetical protein
MQLPWAWMQGLPTATVLLWTLQFLFLLGLVALLCHRRNRQQNGKYTAQCCGSKVTKTTITPQSRSSIEDAIGSWQAIENASSSDLSWSSSSSGIEKDETSSTTRRRLSWREIVRMSVRWATVKQYLALGIPGMHPAPAVWYEGAGRWRPVMHDFL